MASEVPSFLEPAKVMNTAMAITVGIAWNNAVKEGVSDFLGLSDAEGAITAAVLITLTVIVLFYLLNRGHGIISGMSGKTPGAGLRGTNGFPGGTLPARLASKDVPL